MRVNSVAIDNLTPGQRVELVPDAIHREAWTRANQQVNARVEDEVAAPP
jgi:hypothetical protein